MNIAASAFASGLLVLGVFVFGEYFLPAIQSGLLASVVLLLIALICTGFGRLVLRLFKTSELSESEKTLIGCTLGLGILSNGMFLLGLLGLMRPWAAVLLLSVMWVTGFTEMRETIESLGANRNLLIRERLAWSIALLLLLGLSFWTTWVPPHQYDALVYHLPLPASYIRSGFLAPMGYLLYSHFPQNAEMLYALGLMMGSDILPQMFSWLAMALSVWWVFEMGKREMPARAALLACVLVASHTSVMLLAATAYVESLVMLWVTAAVLSYCRWRESAGVGSKKGWLVLAGIFAGLGVGTKYTAGICAAVLTLMLMYRWFQLAFKDSRVKDLGGRDLAIFICTAVLAGCPWLIKNYIVLGNPIFPFLYDRLPHRGIAWGAENAAHYFHFLVEYEHLPGHFFSDLIRVPYLVMTGSTNLGGGIDALGVLGWAVIIALIPVGVWGSVKNSYLRRVGIYCVWHLAAWYSTRIVLRYLTAVVPLLCMVEAAGFFLVWENLKYRGRAALAAGLGLLLACNLGVFLYVHTMFTSWNLLLGLESKEQFLSRLLDYYPCASWAQGHLDNNDKILIVGDQRSFYVRQDAVATTPMAPNYFVEWANQSRSSAELAQRLKLQGRFTHLLVVPREAQRLGGYGIFSFTDSGYKNFTGLEDGALAAAYKGPYCALLKIQ